MSVDMPGRFLIRVNAEHELMVGKAIVQERTRRVGQGGHIGSSLRRND
jgi:hypothetical protein